MRLFVLWLLMVSVLHAEEELSIEAFWIGPDRLREEMELEDGDKMPEQKAADVKPEESRFFDQQDILWDLSEHYRQKGFDTPEGWISYNETTGYLVAKARAHELGALELRHKVDMVPVTIRLSVEVFDVGEASSGWIDWKKKWDKVEKKLLFAVAGVGRVGEVGTQRFEGEDGLKSELEFKSEIDPEGLLHDVRVSWKIESDTSKFSLDTGFGIADNTPYFLELGTIKEGGVQVARFLPETILVGGPPLHEWHSYEQEANRLKLPQKRSFTPSMLRDECERRLRCWTIGKGIFRDLREPTSEDPFAEDGGEKSSIPDPVALENVPAILRKDFPREQWVDVRSFLADAGLDLGEKDFVFYGRLQGVLAAGIQSEEQLALFDRQVSPMLWSRPENIQSCFSLLIESGDEKRMIAKSILSTRSGETTKVNWNWKSGRWKLEAQPSIGGEGTLYDIRLLSEFEGQQTFEMKSGVTYRQGQPREFLLKKTDEETYLLRLEMVLVDAFGQPREEKL